MQKMNEAQVGIHSPTGDRRPRVSPDAAERIREWHEAASHAASGDGRSEQTLTYRGMTVVTPPGMKRVTAASHLLGEAILATVHPEDIVLDIGCGSGVNAILAASLGAHVVAVDVNARACDVARRNVEHTDLADRIEVHQSDLFSEVAGQFDLTIYEQPFRWRDREDPIAAVSSKEDVPAMMTFLRAASSHLLPDGRVLLLLNPPGTREYLEQLCDESGLTADLVAQERQIEDGRPVDFFAFRLTATPSLTAADGDSWDINLQGRARDK